MKNTLQEIKESYKANKNISIILRTSYTNNDEQNFLLQEIKKYAIKNKIEIFENIGGSGLDYEDIFYATGKNLDINQLANINHVSYTDYNHIFYDCIKDNLNWLIEKETFGVGILDMNNIGDDGEDLFKRLCEEVLEYIDDYSDNKQDREDTKEIVIKLIENIQQS